MFLCSIPFSRGAGFCLSSLLRRGAFMNAVPHVISDAQFLCLRCTQFPKERRTRRDKPPVPCRPGDARYLTRLYIFSVSQLSNIPPAYSWNMILIMKYGHVILRIDVCTIYSFTPILWREISNNKFWRSFFLLFSNTLVCFVYVMHDTGNFAK